MTAEVLEVDYALEVFRRWACCCTSTVCLVLQVVLSPGDMLDVPKGMEHYAETVGDEVVTFVDATRH